MIPKEALEAGITRFDEVFNGMPDSRALVTEVITAALAAIPAPRVVETTPTSTHLEESQTVQKLCDLHEKFLRALEEKSAFKMFWANDLSEMADLVLDAATELDKAARHAPSPQPGAAIEPSQDLASENERLRAALAMISAEAKESNEPIGRSVYKALATCGEIADLALERT